MRRSTSRVLLRPARRERPVGKLARCLVEGGIEDPPVARSHPSDPGVARGQPPTHPEGNENVCAVAIYVHAFDRRVAPTRMGWRDSIPNAPTPGLGSIGILGQASDSEAVGSLKSDVARTVGPPIGGGVEDEIAPRSLDDARAV